MTKRAQLSPLLATFFSAACECDDFCDPFMDDAGVCVEQGGQWVRMNQNFDHIGNAMMTLFEISTTEGWVDVMYAAMDATGRDV